LVQEWPTREATLERFGIPICGPANGVFMQDGEGSRIIIVWPGVTRAGTTTDTVATTLLEIRIGDYQT
jgi:hypothetical protein